MSFIKLTSVSAALAFAAVGASAQGIDLPDPLELAQAADACGGFVVESARYVDNFTNLSIRCTTTPAPIVIVEEDDEIAGFIPLLGNLGPGGIAAFAAGGVAVIAGLTSDGDGGAPSDTQ